MNRFKKIYFLLMFPMAAIVVEAGLEFERSEFEATANFGEDQVPFEFAFRNLGDEPVEITNVRTSCGCTTSELEQRIYLPGESGVIEGVFKVGNRQGTQRQHVHVDTDNAGQSSTRLNVVVSIPQAVKIEPRLVRWGLNEEPDPKVVKLTPNTTRGVTVKDVTANSDDFAIELIESNRPGEPLEVIVAPLITDTASRTAIKVSATNEDGSSRDFFVHAMVR